VQLSFNPSKENIGNRVIAGASWQFGLTAVRILITMGSTVFLARLLTPGDYGLVAMSNIVTEMAALFANLGFGQILIQKKIINRLHFDSIFWASALIGFILFILTVLISFPAAWFFEQNELIAVLSVAGLNFIFRELYVVPNAILHRLLLFKIEALIMLLQLILRALFSIYFAWLGWGYWSLVIGPLLSGLVEIVCVVLYVGYYPRLRVNKAFIRSNLRQNGSYLGSGVLHYLMSNFDYIVVGRRFGAEQLGFYQMAYSLPDELRNRLSGPLQRVLFPAFSLLQDDLVAFRRGVEKSQRFLSIAVLPIGAGLALTAEEVVLLLYGEQWRPVIPLLQILAIGGALRALFSLVGSIYYACGRADLAFKINLYATPFVVTCIFLGSEWGVKGIAWAMIVVMLPAFITVYFAMKLIDSSVFTFYKTIFPAVIATLFMAVMILIFSHIELIKYLIVLLETNGIYFSVFNSYLDWYVNLQIIATLFIKVGVGIISYIVFIAIFNKVIFIDILMIVKSILYRRGDK